MSALCFVCALTDGAQRPRDHEGVHGHVPTTDYYDGRDGSIEADDDDEDRIADQDLNREGDPAWNGAFDKW